MNRRTSKRIRGLNPEDSDEDKENQQRQKRLPHQQQQQPVSINDNHKLAEHEHQHQQQFEEYNSYMETHMMFNTSPGGPSGPYGAGGRSGGNAKVKNMYKQVQTVVPIAPESIREANRKPPINVNSQKYDHLSVDTHRQVTFKALMHESCLKRDAHVRMKFILDKTLEPIEVHCELNQENALTKNETHYITLTAKARLPILRNLYNDQINFFYYYYLETPSTTDPNGIVNIEENLLAEKSQVRYFSFNLEQLNIKSNKKMSRAFGGGFRNNQRNAQNAPNANTVNDDDNFSLHQIDGLVLIDTFRYEEPKIALAQMKKDFIEIMLPVNQLATRNIKELNAHSRLIKNFCRTYHCLCLDDKEYQTSFENYLVTEFERLLDDIFKKKLNTNIQFEDWNYMSLMTMFYMAYIFELKLFNNKDWLNTLFAVHQPNHTNLTYLNAISTYFTTDQEIKIMNEALERYLKQNTDSVHAYEALNAVVMHYYFNKRAPPAEAHFVEGHSGLSAPSSAILKVMMFAVNSTSTSEKVIKPFYDSYIEIMNADPDFGALFVNFFALNNEKALDLFLRQEQLSPHIFVHYLSFIVFNRHFVKQSELGDRFLQRFVHKLADFLRAKSFQHIDFIMRDFKPMEGGGRNRNAMDPGERGNVNVEEMNRAKAYIHEYSKVLGKTEYLLRNLIRIVPKETDLMIYVIQINVTYLQLIQILTGHLSYLDDVMKSLGSSFNSILNAIKNWLNKEFSESLLINYGIESRPNDIMKAYNEQQERIRALQEKFTQRQSRQQQQQAAAVAASEMLMMDRYEFEEMMVGEDMFSMSRFEEMNDPDVMEMQIQPDSQAIYLGLTNEPEIYAQLLNIQFMYEANREMARMSSTISESQFRNRILDLFQERLKAQIDVDFRQLIQIRSEFDFGRFQKSSRECQEMFNKVISERLFTSNSPSDIYLICDCLKENQEGPQTLLWYFVDDLLKKKWPRNSNQELEFILKWDPFLTLLECQCKPQSISKPLNKNWFDTFLKALKSFTQSIDKIVRGEEKISVVKLFDRYCDNAIKIIKLSLEQNNFANSFLITPANFVYFRSLIQARMKEANEFESYQVNLRAFLQFCSLFKQINLDVYHKRFDTLKKMKNIEDELSLVNVCEPLSFEGDLCKKNAPDLGKYIPKVTYFEKVDTALMVTIKEIINLNRSFCVIFDDYFKIACDAILAKLRVPTLTLINVIHEVWPLALSKWKDLAKIIDDETIKLTQLDDILAQYFGNDYPRMQRELIYWIDYLRIRNYRERSNQIDLYNRFRSSVDVANSIEDIRIKLQMQEKFTELDDLLNIKSAQFQSWTIAKMNKVLEQTINVLDKMNGQDKLNCLKAYIESLELVEWLRTNTNGLGELKFLVDLASSTSSNETSAQNVKKDLLAKALKEAGTAFASLIYELKQDDNFGQFMALCLRTCSHLESDKNIAEKLLAVKEQVPLLEQIKKMKGSVELSSLKQAKKINENGVYRLGNLSLANKAKTSAAAASSQLDGQLKISNVIELELDITGENLENPAETTKIYNYDGLKELQNILMLVAPRKSKSNKTAAADDEVEERINAEDEDESATLEYFIQLFDGIVRAAETYLKLVQHGCTFFEKFVAHIFCDILNKRIAPEGQSASSNEPSLLITSVQVDKSQSVANKADSTLSSLAYLCRFMDDCFDLWCSFITRLRDEYDTLNYFTFNQIDFLRIKVPELLAAAKSEEAFAGHASFEALESMLYNFAPSLARDLLERTFKESLDLKQEYKMTNLADFFKRFHQKHQDANAETNEAFMTDLHQIWTRYLGQQYGQTNLATLTQTHMTIEHLAVMLKLLERANSAGAMSVQRKVPGYLNNRGQPNLIVCSSKEQIPVVLSIYAQSMQMPMPSNDEVLFCSEGTTSEEVENFLRIAYKSNGDRIYTLMNIQELSYENSNKVDQFLATNVNLHRTKSERFVLVCICCTEKQAQSILTSSLIKYKIKPIILPATDLREYLMAKLHNTGAETGSLSRFDPHGSSVRALLSHRSGNGKSQYAEVLREKVAKELGKFNYKVIRIKSYKLSIDQEVGKLFASRQAKEKSGKLPTIYHIDIAYEAFFYVDLYLFNLIVCGHLKHSSGQVWRRNAKRDLYLIEMTPPFVSQFKFSNHFDAGVRMISIHSMLNYLPKIDFRTPKMYLYDLKNDPHNQEQLMDNLFTLYYGEERYQRTVFYLNSVKEYKRIKKEKQAKEKAVSFRAFRDDGAGEEAEEILNKKFGDANAPRYDQATCLETLLTATKLTDPNWLELNNYVRFLHQQLETLERANVIDVIPMLRGVLVQFIVIMADDFGLPSLNIIEEEANPRDQMAQRQDSRSSFDVTADNEIQISMTRLEVHPSRRWESMMHPLLIFNSDDQTFTFMGCYLDRTAKRFVNPNTKEFLDAQNADFPNIMAHGLFLNLIKQRVPVFDNFNEFIREKKLLSLCNVMGLPTERNMVSDPDPSYELTVDNCLKLMAIYLRFKCNNPVVIMGETGCGKTRLIKFFCDLHTKEKFLMHVKIHGGTTADDIAKKLREAERLAEINHKRVKNSTGSSGGAKSAPVISAVLFFDEANTTEAVGLIKEIMCDFTCNGRPIDLDHGLKIVAAVNPYKRHSQEMIEKLEQAGLGFYISANETKEKLGQIPMRQLIYRVQPLPSSMIPLVWDFGQLERTVENVYIKQMINKAIIEGRLPDLARNEPEIDLICKLLSESQNFMRKRNDECSFVSLRDIERVIKVSAWFLEKRQLLFDRIAERKIEHFDDAYQASLTPVRRAFVLGLSVCYHASLYNLQTRQQYRMLIASLIPSMPATDWMQCEILKCQNVFLDEIQLAQKNIARNSALLENVFMMVVCIELRIPLFIVGKPGSSKSLAKSIVANAMEGRNSKSALFQNLKETYFVNFQCSPLTTPEMIVKAFKEAARFQESNDLTKSVAIVNLDEIGLAEGSDSMPLKALHPLLEEGTDTEEIGQPWQKVGVIGISNWALDPAKMNRGIFVSRGEPDIEELIESAKGICKYDEGIFKCIEPYISEVAHAYLDLCQMAREHKREFFGLRDFYSLVKMLYWFCSKDRNFTWYKLEHAVKRNFSGLELDPVEPFRTYLASKLDSRRFDTDPKCGPIDLIKSALKSEHVESNSRYLLFITENNTAIDIIQNYLINVVKVPAHNLTVIFGSSFRHDQQYTEVCRNISLIKHSMEIGKTIILLNSYNLYESLYDALNQYYSEFAGQKYVDLGLGTHRVKCLVHPNFRLIVIAEKAAVYDSKRFPIPLVNRLEKHFLNAATMLDRKQKRLVDQIDAWIDRFCKAGNAQAAQYVPKYNEIFIGHDADTTATLVLFLTETNMNLNAVGGGGDTSMRESDEQESDTLENQDELLRISKCILLRCATADSIVRLSSSKRMPEAEKDFLWNEYFVNQKHLSLVDLVVDHVSAFDKMKKQGETGVKGGLYLSTKNLLQITTHSKSSITNIDPAVLAAQLGIRDPKRGIEMCLLQAFDTQQQFSRKIKDFLAAQSQQQQQQQQGEASKNAADSSIMSVDEATGEPRVILVQADLTHKYSLDLIACARHTIVEELKEAVSKAESNETQRSVLENSFIVFVINIPREHVKKFIGFQLSHWSCYHVDELEDVSNDLPPFEVLKFKPLSQLLKEGLDESYNKDPAQAKTKYLNLSMLFKRIAHNACSLIVDTNLTRTIKRIDIFIKLCDNPDFVQVIGKRLIRLQEEKERYIPKESVIHWLTKEAADIKSINEYSTLRRACQNYFESKFSPLLGFLLSYIDLHSNVDIFTQSNEDAQLWKADLWLRLLENEEICKLSYDDMRSKVSYQNEEIRNFNCESEWLSRKFTDDQDQDENRYLRPCLPFFWLLISQLNDLYVTYFESSRIESSEPVLNQRQPSGKERQQLTVEELAVENKTKLVKYIQQVSKFFEDTALYSALTQIIDKYKLQQQQDFNETFIDYYINDFVLRNCKVKSRKDLKFIMRIIRSLLNHLEQDVKFKSNLKLCLPVIHYQFEIIRDKIDVFLKFSSYEPSINSAPLFQQDDYYTLKSNDSNCLEIDLDSCLICIDSFKKNFKQTKLNQTLLHKLCTLLQLVSTLATGTASANSAAKLKLINEQYEGLIVLRIFIDFVALNGSYNSEELTAGLMTELLNKLNFEFFAKDTNFKTKASIIALNKFVIECKSTLEQRIRAVNGAATSAFDVERFEENLNFFYMNIIECLCFRSAQKPDNEAIECILSLITNKTVTLDDGRNFTFKPTCRALLIQIIFRNYNDIVISHLNMWFNEGSLIGKLFDSSIEVALFFQNCVGDHYVHRQGANAVDDQIKLAIKLLDEINDCNTPSSPSVSLERIFDQKIMRGVNFNVKALLTLSKLKFCLSVLAKVVNSQDSLESVSATSVAQFNYFNTQMKQTVEKIAPKTNTVFNFLIKEIIRKYGSASIKFVLSNEQLRWITPESIIGKNQHASDKFVLAGQRYWECRDAINKAFRENNLKSVQELLDHDSAILPYFAIACYQHVTLLYKNVQNITTKIAELFDPILARYEAKIRLRAIVYNAFTHNLKVSDESWADVDLSLLVIQFKYAVLFSKSKIIKPLQDLLTAPGTMGDTFIPTMPQDYFFDIKTAVMSASNQDNPKFYTCPNGHPYFIGDCGRPWVLSKCKECGADIGGSKHELIAENKVIDDQIKDNTVRGYCLPDASHFDNTPTTDRLLNAPGFHTIRFIVHACMYLACGDESENEEEVRKCMTVKKMPDNLKDFFWRHMKKDLSLIAKALNVTLDEVYLLLHKTGFDMLKNTVQSTMIAEKLSSKDSRQTWEDIFYKTFLLVAHKKVPMIVNEANEIIKEKDVREDENQSKIYFMAYELLNRNTEKDAFIYENEQFWKFRPNITFDMMRIEFVNSGFITQYPILNKFSDLCYELEALADFSQIVRLLTSLHKHFYKVLFKHNARNKSIKEFIETNSMPNDFTLQTVETLIAHLQRAWSFCSRYLTNHINATITNSSSINIERDFKFTIDTKLSYFLPTLYGDGLACYGILHYLASVQNDMIEFYNANKKIKSDQPKNVELFKNKDLVIVFDKNNDLFRIIQANFTYDSKQLKCVFQYGNIENQIIDRYIRTKPLIDLTTVPLFEYSDEINDYSIFERLDVVARQETFDASTQLDVFTDFTKTNEISEALNTLKIIINYARTTFADKNETIGQFLKKIYVEGSLKNSELILKSRITETCQLKHLKHIFILLLMKRAVIFTNNGLDPFENLSNSFKAEKAVTLPFHLDGLLLVSTLFSIFQIIMFRLVTLSGEDMETFGQMNVQDVFATLDDLSILIMDNLRKLPDNFPDDPVSEEKLKMINIFSLWKALSSLIKT